MGYKIKKNAVCLCAVAERQKALAGRWRRAAFALSV